MKVAISALCREIEPSIKRPLLIAPDDLVKYSQDESPCEPMLPDLVVQPTTPDEVAFICQAAYHRNIPITPRGGGTGRVGGAIPTKGGVVLDLSLLNSIVSFDPTEFSITVQAGMITQQLHEHVEREHLFYPVIPSSYDSCTIGGNIATNAGGSRALKYGVTGNYVMALTAVTPQGRIITMGKKTHKQVAGFNMAQLLVASEGTLATIADVTLRLLPLPPEVLTMWVEFDSQQQAFAFLDDIRHQGIELRAAELFSMTSLDIVQKHSGIVPFWNNAGHASIILLLECDGWDLQYQEAALMKVLESSQAIECLVASSEKQRQMMWEVRHGISSSLRKEFLTVQALDVCVPLSKLSALIETCSELQSKYAISGHHYGHVGDGNLHITFCAADDDQRVLIDTVHAQVLQFVWEHDGTMSAEHGIGILKRHHLTKELSAEALDIQRSIKQIWDPKGLMNPHSLFPDHSTVAND